MGSADLRIKQAILKVLSKHFIISHNQLKKIIVSKGITSPRTFEKYLQDLVREGKVFRVPEEKIRIPVKNLDDESKHDYMGTRGTHMVFYTLQGRLFGLKEKFLEFYNKEYKTLNDKFQNFVKMNRDIQKQKRLDAISDFSMSLFALDSVIMSVYSLGAHWKDFSYQVNDCKMRLDILRTLFFRQIQQNHKDLYTKFFTKQQLKFLESNEIYPFNFGKVDYQ
ncbi:MAG: hypothetical protein P4K92_03745 [Candidatus Nitrosotalea sp.]|nr:hypothetical protein [Candidatus Nitrosotalea sp.]